MGRDGSHTADPRPIGRLVRRFLLLAFHTFWTLRAHPIHPPRPGRLKFFNDERFEAVIILWQKLCKRLSGQYRSVQKPLAEPQPIVKSEWVVPETFEYESCNYAPSHQTERWRWIRVYEYFKEKNSNERYEFEEMMAQKLSKRHHIDRMLIHYNY
jgi:hypothetical protein